MIDQDIKDMFNLFLVSSILVISIPFVITFCLLEVIYKFFKNKISKVEKLLEKS